MSKTEELAALIPFRQELYDSLSLRQDSLFELVDAALTAAHRSTLVRLSLTAVFRRMWPSTCDALADGSIDVRALRTQLVRELPESVTIHDRPLWVIDGTNWPRPAARASADRTWEYRPLPGWPHSGIVPAWAYQWLVAVPDVAGSWVLPLDVQRRGPTAKSATQVALDQIAAVRAAQAQVHHVPLSRSTSCIASRNSVRAAADRVYMASRFGWLMTARMGSRSIRPNCSTPPTAPLRSTPGLICM